MREIINTVQEGLGERLVESVRTPSFDDIRDFQRMQGWDESSDEDIEEAIGLFGQISRNGKLTVYRALDIDNPSDLRANGHRHWAYDERYATSYGGSGDASMIITAEISDNDVDWLSTLAVQSMGEREIRPEEDAPLRVIGIAVHDRPVKFKKGMTLYA